jgi:hypothetical protein
MERDPTPREVGQGGEQRNKYRFHTGNATWASTEKSIKSGSKEFLVGTGTTIVDINQYQWEKHCRGLFQLPAAA